MALLQYDFSVVGLNVVYRALAGVEARFIQTAKRMEAVAARTGGRVAGGGGGRAGGGGGRSAISENQRQSDKETRYLVQQEEQRKRKLLQAKERTAMALRRQSERESRRLEMDQRREGERWRRLAQASSDKRLREEMAQARAGARAQQQFRKSIYGAGLSGAGKALKGIGSMATMGIGLGGGIAAAAIVKNAMAADVQARKLANQGFGTDSMKGKSRQEIAKELLASAGRESIRTGMSKESVLSAFEGIQSKAGNLKAAQDLAPWMIDVMQGQGISGDTMGNMVGMAFNATKNMAGVTDKAGMAKQIVEKVVAMAKAGSMTPEEAAAQMGPLMGEVMKGGGDPLKTLGFMGSVMQLSAGSEAPSAAEAMTAVRRITSDMESERGRKGLKALGIDAYKKTMIAGKEVNVSRDPVEMLSAIIGKTHGDKAALGKIFNEESIKAINPMMELYRGGAKGAKGGSGADAHKAGLAALEAGLAGAGMYSEMGKGQIAEDAAFMRESDQGKLDIATQKFNEAIGTQLMPAVTKLIPKLTEMIEPAAKVTEALVKLAAFFLDNPFLGLGAIVSGYIVKEMAAAAIGNKIAALLSGGKALPGGGVVPGVTPGGGGKGVPVVGPLAVLATAMAIPQESKRLDDINKQIDAETANGGEVSRSTKNRAARQMMEGATPIVPVLRMLGMYNDPTGKTAGSVGEGDGGGAWGKGKISGGKVQISGEMVTAANAHQKAASAILAAANALTAAINASGGLGGGLARPAGSPTANR